MELHCVVIAESQITVLDTIDRYRVREVITIKKHIKIAALACVGVLVVFLGLIWYREASIKQFLSDYYEDLYDGYVTMQYVDVAPYLDMSRPLNQNIVVLHKEHVRYRWWIDELGTGYIGKEQEPYRIMLGGISKSGEELRVEFRFVGEQEVAYPYFISTDPYFYTCYLRSPGKEGKPYVIRKISNDFEDGQWEYHGFYMYGELTDEEIREDALNLGEASYINHSRVWQIPPPQ